MLIVVVGRLVRIMSNLEDWETTPFLNQVCSKLFDLAARSVKWCRSIRAWRAADVALLRISWLLESSGSRMQLKSPSAITCWVLYSNFSSDMILEVSLMVAAESLSLFSEIP